MFLAWPGALGSTLGSVEKRQVQKGHDKKRRKLTYTWVLELIFALNALNLNEVTAKLQKKSHFGKSLRAGVIKCLIQLSITMFSLDDFFFFRIIVKLLSCEKATKFEKKYPTSFDVYSLVAKKWEFFSNFLWPFQKT